MRPRRFSGGYTSYCRPRRRVATSNLKLYLKERGLCDKIYQYVIVLSEINLPHNSSPYDL